MLGFVRLPSRQLALSLLMLGCLSLMQACLEADTSSGPGTPRPDQLPPAVETNEVVLRLAPASLAGLRGDAESLRISIFRLAGDVRGDILRQPTRYVLNDEGGYRLSDLPLETLEFFLELLDGDGKRLAQGTTRATVERGRQNLPLVLLQVERPTSPPDNNPIPPVEPPAAEPNFAALDLSVSFNLIGFPGGVVQLPEQPAEVRAILANSCLYSSCHTKADKRGRLDLETYPYVSSNPNLSSLPMILDMINQRVAGTVPNRGPMPPVRNPPFPPVTAEGVAELLKFADAVKQSPTQVDPQKWIGEAEVTIELDVNSEFKGKLLFREGSTYRLGVGPVLNLGTVYPFALELKSVDGQKLFETRGTLTHSGAVALKFDVAYSSVAN